MPTVTKQDRMAQVLAAVRDLTRQHVMVGIPDSTAGRKTGPISNAAIGYIQEHGDPAHNLPARPFLVPGVSKIAGKAADILGNGARKALDGDRQGAAAALVTAGLLAQNSARATLTAGEGFAPLSPMTIEGRARRGQKRAKRALKAMAAGGVADPGDVKPLIDTGQLRTSLTFVVRKA